MYYLQSRYYDPAIGRFINADTFATTDADGFLSCNMFAYCENDPVNHSDPDGEELWGALIGGLANAAFSVASQYLADGKVDWTKVAVSGITGAIAGFGFPKKGVDAFFGAVAGFADSWMSTRGQKDLSLGDRLVMATASAGIGALSSVAKLNGTSKQFNSSLSSLSKGWNGFKKAISKGKPLLSSIKKSGLAFSTKRFAGQFAKSIAGGIAVSGTSYVIQIVSAVKYRGLTQ